VVLCVWPQWQRPDVILLVLAQLAPLGGLIGDPGGIRRAAALLVGLCLLGGAVTLSMQRAPTDEGLIVDRENGVELRLPSSFRAVRPGDVADYCPRPRQGAVGGFVDSAGSIGGLLIVSHSASLTEFLNQTANELGLADKEGSAVEPIVSLAAFPHEQFDFRIDANGRDRRGSALAVRTADGRVVSLIVTAAPTVFHAVRASLLAIENGLTIRSEPRP
jgi:hypothetical protein